MASFKPIYLEPDHLWYPPTEEQKRCMSPACRGWRPPEQLTVNNSAHSGNTYFGTVNNIYNYNYAAPPPAPQASTSTDDRGGWLPKEESEDEEDEEEDEEEDDEEDEEEDEEDEEEEETAAVQEPRAPPSPVPGDRRKRAPTPKTSDANVAEVERRIEAFHKSRTPVSAEKRKTAEYKRKVEADIAEHRATTLQSTDWAGRTANCYHTKLRVNSKTIAMYAYTLADAQRAVELKHELERDLIANSLLAQRAARDAAFAANADKRAADVATWGDNGAQERNAILTLCPKLVDVTKNDGGAALEFAIMCDGAKPDVLFRTEAMAERLPCLWLMWQHKTTEKKNKVGAYAFSDTRGYTGMLLVCESLENAPDALDTHKFWVFGGAKVTAANVTICTKTDLSERSSKGTGYVMPYRSVRELAMRAQVECAKALAGKPDALPRVTQRQAMDMVGKTCKIELEGIRLYNAHALERHGRTFKFPSAQNSKTDLLEFAPEEVAAPPQTLQFKTVKKGPDRQTWHANITTRAGTISGVQKTTNYYAEGDNDYYVFVLPPIAVHGIQGKLYVWKIPQAAMLANGYIGPNAKGCIGLMKPGQETLVGTRCKCQWTAEWWTEYDL